MEALSTIVLAGGASTRMGAPKALLRFGPETAIERVIRRLRAISASVIVVSAPHLSLPPLGDDVRVVEDPQPLLGPIAGIRNGLRAAPTDLAFVCGCDQPLLVPEVALLLAAEAAGAPGAVAVWGDRREPLVAVYRKHVADLAEQMLLEGSRRAQDLAVRARLVDVTEAKLRAVDPSGASFFDVDTPESYCEALRRVASELNR